MDVFPSSKVVEFLEYLNHDESEEIDEGDLALTILALYERKAELIVETKKHMLKFNVVEAIFNFLTFIICVLIFIGMFRSFFCEFFFFFI